MFGAIHTSALDQLKPVSDEFVTRLSRNAHGSGLRDFAHFGRNFTQAAGLLGLAVAGSAFGQCHYTYQEIVPPPGWPHPQPMAINNLGHVAGYLENDGETSRGFIWTPESGTQIMPDPPGTIFELRAHDINDLGHVVGWMSSPSGVTAFFWDGKNYTLIPSPYPQTRIEANSINNLDQVVGTINGGAVGRIAFRWESGSLIELTPIIGLSNSNAVAIDERSVIAGDATVVGASHAFVLEPDVRWLPEPGVVDTNADTMSNNGLVAGQGNPSHDQSDPNYRGIGMVWDGPVTHLIVAAPGFRDTHCLGINNAARVVGMYRGPDTRSYVWQAGLSYEFEPFTDGVRILIPDAINNFGQIACRSRAGRIVLTPHWKPGDLTGDCAVSLDDLILLLADFGAPVGSYPRADVDLDGDVDLSDLSALLSNWGM